jgi:hypothetical protein
MAVTLSGYVPPSITTPTDPSTDPNDPVNSLIAALMSGQLDPTKLAQLPPEVQQQLQALLQGAQSGTAATRGSDGTGTTAFSNDAFQQQLGIGPTSGGHHHHRHNKILKAAASALGMSSPDELRTALQNGTIDPAKVEDAIITALKASPKGGQGTMSDEEIKAIADRIMAHLQPPQSPPTDTTTATGGSTDGTVTATSDTGGSPPTLGALSFPQQIS